jgi:hypothetical protein
VLPLVVPAIRSLTRGGVEWGVADQGHEQNNDRGGSSGAKSSARRPRPSDLARPGAAAAAAAAAATAAASLEYETALDRAAELLQGAAAGVDRGVAAGDAGGDAGGDVGGGAGGGAAARASVSPHGYRVEGAGSAEVDGLYVRDGEYGGAPLFKKGRLWLLRYRVPSSGLGRADGRTAHLWWYIADKDSLHADDGDLYMYRIRCAEPGDEGLPPTRANWSLAKDGRSPAPRVAAVESEPEPAGRAAPRVPLPAHVGFVQARTRLLLTSGL